MKFVVLVATSTLLFAGVAQASVIQQESFESAPGGSYSLSSQFDDGQSDFFGRYAVPDNGNVARDDFQTGWDGRHGILGQDHDGQGGAATQSVTIAGINITNFKNLIVTAAFGALNSEPNFFNFEAAEGDGIKLFASIDAGAKTLIAEFAPPASGAGDLRLDTDADQIGDGAILTIGLADFTFALPGLGTSLTLEFELTSTTSFETLAMDNVRVEGASTVPVPPAMALLGAGIGLLGLAGYRRRQQG